MHAVLIPGFVACQTLDDYVARCLHLLHADITSSADTPIPWLNDLTPPSPEDSARWCTALLQAPQAQSRIDTGTTIHATIDTLGMLPATFMAKAMGYRIVPVSSLDAVAGAAAQEPLDAILVALADEIEDTALMPYLSGFGSQLAQETPWAALPRLALVTGRDLRALSWMVAKLISSRRKPPSGSAIMRHIVPNDGHANVTTIRHPGDDCRLQQATLQQEALLATYSQAADVMVVRTHGSESCAFGGAGAVLCGRGGAAKWKNVQGDGALACGCGHPCPRGPKPMPLEQLNARVLMLCACNGFRLADSINNPEFNFALSFADGPGEAYVSSLFTSSGADAAAAVFFAAMADGMTLSNATSLANALLFHTRIEQPAYLLMGDPHATTAPARAQAHEAAHLPNYVDGGAAHCMILRIADPELVSMARQGAFGFVLTGDEGTAPFGFHRVERKKDFESGTESAVVVLYMFGFPHALGRVSIRALDIAALSHRARKAQAALATWIDLWRATGLAARDTASFAELQETHRTAQTMLAATLPQTNIDGSLPAYLEQQVTWMEAALDTAQHEGLEQLSPQLQGSFWLPNVLANEFCLTGVEAASCPSCGDAAFVRSLRHGCSNHARRTLVCPRCGIGWDALADGPIESIRIALDGPASPGRTLQVSVAVQVREATMLRLAPRLSTPGQTTPPPMPAMQQVHVAEPGMMRFNFLFELPAQLLPHRYYVKVLFASDADLGFASRPFFACNGINATSQSSSDSPISCLETSA